ncbi:unnamed protein product [Schistocephalus solidus]|uniref:Uncharacterized protein n=1 Tax=Schistocephalus solidus TaxID=70667 RepID=A0A3P7DDS2_SCHSO|nr:unnamed protein product [Schistocephalus solidus]
MNLPSSLPETIRAVQQISSGNAPGSDAIPLEFYKHGGPLLMAELTAFFQEMWCQGQVPQDFKDAPIVNLYKWKGNRQLVAQNRREDLHPYPPQSSERSSGAGPVPGTPMWLPPTPRNNRHDLCRLPATKEVPGDANSPKQYLRGSVESLLHGES